MPEIMSFCSNCEKSVEVIIEKGKEEDYFVCTVCRTKNKVISDKPKNLLEALHLFHPYQSD